MTVPSRPRCFQIAGLPRLRSAGKLEIDNIDEIWATVNNDEFYSLATYVSAFTGIGLKGYRQKEEREAYDACAKTLDALETVANWMNQSAALTRLADLVIAAEPYEVSGVEVQTAWDTFIASTTAPASMINLLRVVQREFRAWATLAKGEQLSHLIKYTTRPIDRDVELAFSGGGVRAAAFALGVIMYVLDVKQGYRIRQISSVSGGSITNGFLANVLTATGNVDDAAVAHFATRLANEGIPLERVGRYLAACAGMAFLLGILGGLSLLLAALSPEKEFLGAALGAFLISIPFGLVAYRVFTGVTDVMVSGWFARTINESPVDSGPPVTVNPFSLKRLRAKVLSANGLTLRALRDIDSPVTHVFTATDLRHGEHFHFSQKWAISNTYGSTEHRDVRVYEAVHASAAFPGALAPVNISLGRLSLPANLTVGLKQLELVDGGVRDNLGHMFQTRLLGSDSQRDTLTQYGRIKLSIVADASAPRGVADLSENVLKRVPVLRRIEQFVTFPRVLSIMNQSNSEARSLALSTNLGSDGFVFRIRDSPVELCSEAIGDPGVTRSLLRNGPGRGHADDPRQLRAEAALRALVRDESAAESHWNSVRNENQATPTTLDGLGADRVARLMRHGYVLTMCHAHVNLDWPLSTDSQWAASRFVNLLKAQSRSPASENAVEVC